LRAFGHEGVTNLDLSDASEAIRWLNETLFSTEKLIVRRRAVRGPTGTVGVSPQLPQDLLDTDDPDVCRLLRDMARHGAGLYNHLASERFVDPGERIQVLNHEPNTYVPLEFVYDRGYPVSNAKVCAAGLEALRSDAEACPGPCDPYHRTGAGNPGTTVPPQARHLGVKSQPRPGNDRPNPTAHSAGGERSRCHVLCTPHVLVPRRRTAGRGPPSIRTPS